MTPPDASLSRLLTLVAKIQQSDRGSAYERNAVDELRAWAEVQVVAVTAQQHAEALREAANWIPDFHKAQEDDVREVADWLDPKEEA